MYTVYNYQAGSTTANVLSDVVAILTGETNKANLSSSCVQSNTTIINTVPSGWTVWDAAAGTNKVTIRALNQDNTTYKYYRFGLTSGSATEGYTCESWSTSTHTGGNGSSVATSVWDSGSGGYFYIYATSKNIVILPWTSAGFQVMNGLIMMEISRVTIPSGYPCFGMHSSPATINGGVSQFYVPRYKKNTATGDTLSSGVTVGVVIASGQSTAGNLAFRDASETVYESVHNIAVYGDNSVYLGNCYDLLATGATVTPNSLDQITYNGNTYVLFKMGTNCIFLIPKG